MALEFDDFGQFLQGVALNASGNPASSGFKQKLMFKV